MTVYTCERCLKDFSQKSHYNTHKKRKIPCQDNSKKISNVLENKITETVEQVTSQIPKSLNSSLQNVHHPINDKVDLFIGDALNLNIKKKVNMIYFDPPFNSDRNYTMSHDNDIGFADKWTDATYETFIVQAIHKLHDYLAHDGTLYFHISSSCMFIPEKVLRD